MSVNLTLPGVSRVFTGADWGETARALLNLDHLDSTEEHVVIHVPEDTLSLNMSYVNALFGQSLKYLGPESFTEKYSFTGRDISATIHSFLKENADNSEGLVKTKHFLSFYLEKIVLGIMVLLLPLEGAGAAIKQANGEAITWQLVCIILQVVVISSWIFTREGNND